MEIARKHWCRGLSTLVIAWGMVAGTASAQVTLRINTPAVVTTGSSFTAELSIEGLGPAGDMLALGAYDLDLLIDSSLLSFTSVVFGDGGRSGLDAGIGGSFTASDSSVPGRLTLREISFESANDLTAAQPASFTLLSVQLTALGPGVWSPRLEAVTLSDQDGVALTATVVATDLTISPVPEPATAILWLAGLTGVALMRRALRR